MFYDIDIVLADGTVHRYSITSKRAILGRSDAAEISISSDELESEHVLFMPRKEGLWVSVSKRATTPLLVDRQPFNHGVLPWGTQASLGSLRLRLVNDLAASNDKRLSVSPVILALSVMVLSLLIWTFAKPSATQSDVHAPAAPPLFEPINKCSNLEGRAEARGLELATQADAKAQRSIFAPQDGIAAVRLYQEAEICFRDSGLGQQALTLTAKRQILERQLNEDFAGSRLRLDSLRQKRQWKQALAELALLKALLSEQRNSYTEWLEQTERHVQLRLIEGEP